MITAINPLVIEEIVILHQMPSTPNTGISKNDNGIRIVVNTIEIIDGIFGKPMPENTPLLIISIAIKICDKPMITK